MAGRTRTSGTAANIAAAPQTTGEAGIAPPKQVRRRKSARSRNRTQSAMIGAASTGTPTTGVTNSYEPEAYGHLAQFQTLLSRGGMNWTNIQSAAATFLKRSVST